MSYCCRDPLRRQAVAAHPTLNGIDALDVVDRDAPTDELRQRTLLLRLLKPVPAGWTPEQVRIEGGERERRITVQWVAPASAPPDSLGTDERARYTCLPQADHVLLVRVTPRGDSAPYTLRLVTGPLDAEPPWGIDPRLAEVAFSFKVECPNDNKGAPVVAAAVSEAVTPALDYLAKDYASFRRLILDRISQQVPGWRERSAADLGVTLAELIAYVGDQLSYRQDAVATEAYLDTARLRSSVRRHARLVDYAMHDGCNARVWLHLTVDADALPVSREALRFYARLPGTSARLEPGSAEELAALQASPVVFEPVLAEPSPGPLVLRQAHNELHFHAWGERRCGLTAGTTSATLAGHVASLAVGDLLLFEEVLGPATGEPADADPLHRHVVRLTRVKAFASPDPVAPAPGPVPLTDPLTDEPITEIAWAQEDALPFALCLSAVTDAQHGRQYLPRVSVARGNLLLADHGYTLPEAEALGTVPPSRLAYAPDRAGDRCQDADPVAIPPRFRPVLARRPLTFAGTVPDPRRPGARRAFDPAAPASAAMQWRLEESLPQLVLEDAVIGALAEPQPWTPRRDLLDSDGQARAFVVEVEHDGSACLRFGDGTHGRRPATGAAFLARYRVGNGRAGNVGAGAIGHVVSADPRIRAVRNPLPAVGGVDPEEVASVRRRAPQAFRRLERAVTPADYAELTQRHAGVQRAAASLRWTGSWHTVFITVDRDGGVPMDPAFEAGLARHLDRYRMAGHDTEFDDPIAVPLEIDLQVCVSDRHFRADVESALRAVLGHRELAGGRRGLFHPDALSFGQTVHLSQVYVAARGVPGVVSVQATRFQRQGIDDPRPLRDGFIRCGRLEIPRLEQDANFPGRGVLRLALIGGK